MKRRVIFILIILAVIILAVSFSLKKQQLLPFSLTTPPQTKTNGTRPMHGFAVIKDNKTGNAIGNAARAEQKKVFTVGLRVKTLPHLAGGMFYAAWLSDGKRLISLGRLTREEKSGDYILAYIAKEDVGLFPTIQITKEAIDDQKPETVVAEGEFK